MSEIDHTLSPSFRGSRTEGDKFQDFCLVCNKQYQEHFLVDGVMYCNLPNYRKESLDSQLYDEYTKGQPPRITFACRIGWHSWSQWGEREDHIYQTGVPITDILVKDITRFVQFRSCTKCHAQTYRFV